MPPPHPHGTPDAGGAPAGITTPEHLAEHLAEVLAPSSVIVCIGNDLCGDDGAGPAVAKRLAGEVPWQVFDTAGVPESFLMKIVNARPASVLLVDALHFGAAAGAVELIDPDAVGGQGPSTHGPAPLAFLEILRMMHPCPRRVLGIQPSGVEFGQPMGEPVARAVDLVVQAFRMLADRADPA